MCSGAKELCTFKYEFCGLFYISSFILGVAEMSSFVVSRNTSQPLMLRDQDVGDKRAPERSYSSNETLNFFDVTGVICPLLYLVFGGSC